MDPRTLSLVVRTSVASPSSPTLSVGGSNHTAPRAACGPSDELRERRDRISIAAATEVAPLAIPLRVDTAEGKGTAIAIANVGSHLAYLVAFRPRDKRAPAWFAESEIEAAWAVLPD